MILTLDIGNTRAKLVLFDQHNIVLHEAFPHAHVGQRLRHLWHTQPQLSALHWCSVGPQLDEWDSLLAQAPCPVRQLKPCAPPAGFAIDYRTPHTLGADRLAAAMGARCLQPEGALLVIDAGTCITYDLLSTHNHLVGGNISPGLSMRLRALHEHTARLPLVAPQGDTPLLGYDTPTALRSGVLRGIAYEMEGHIDRLAQEYGAISTFFTGGNDFRSLISAKFRTFADDFLVARGLAAM